MLVTTPVLALAAQTLHSQLKHVRRIIVPLYDPYFSFIPGSVRVYYSTLVDINFRRSHFVQLQIWRLSSVIISRIDLLDEL